MTSKTLLKARIIFKNGGVSRTGVRIYRVASTSGETYGVVLAERAVCTCPATVMCSHIAAAEIARVKRAKGRTHAAAL